MSLLQKAKLILPKKRKVDISDEEIELGIGYLKGEVTFGQASRAVGKNGAAFYTFIITVIMQLIIDGRVKIS